MEQSLTIEPCICIGGRGAWRLRAQEIKNLGIIRAKRGRTRKSGREVGQKCEILKTPMCENRDVLTAKGQEMFATYAEIRGVVERMLRGPPC